jgi:hypothetical protein
VERIQVHHLCYRGTPESTLLKDLETLCRKCHRLEHGLGPTDFEELYRKILDCIHRLEKPPVELWKQLKAVIKSDNDVIGFGELMFAHVMISLAHAKEKQPGWWMNKKKKLKWFRKAFRVRKSIWERVQ